jgi:hypothetical protein
MEIKTLGYTEKSGHYYKRMHMEAYESTDNCGTCDGALCDICHDFYTVEDRETGKILYHGRDKEKAISIAGYNFVR